MRQVWRLSTSMRARCARLLFCLNEMTRLNIQRAKGTLFSAFAFPVALVAVMALIHLLGVIGVTGSPAAWGNHPRELSGLSGILTSHLRHASWGHWLSNAIPLIMLAGTSAALLPKATRRAWLIIPSVGGVLLWLFGRDAIHIGASGLVYGWFFFLVSMAFLNRSAAAIIGLVFAFALFGGLIWVFEGGPGVSWEGHVSGAAAGVFSAWVLRRRRAVQRRAIIR